MTDVKPVPEGYHSITPYLCVDGAAAAIDFYKDVFGATERMRMAGPDGKVGHAEIDLGDSVVMLSDEHPDIGVLGPKSIGGTSVSIMVYLDDVDAAVDRAVAAGATVINPAEDKFYGDRSADIVDPFGHRWTVSTHVEDVPPEEMEKRAAEAMGGGGSS